MFNFGNDVVLSGFSFAVVNTQLKLLDSLPLNELHFFLEVYGREVLMFSEDSHQGFIVGEGA